jgi:hypothetical protein
MKKTLLRALIVVITLIFTMVSCKKNDDTPCADLGITTKKTDANAGINNGSITITSPKGNGITYSLNGGAAQTDTVFKNLAIGSYTITVKNAQNCTSTVTVALVDPCNGVTVSVVTTKVDAITGQANGSITVTSPVGSGITYSINGGSFQASTNFNNLGAGSYTITAKTAAGCVGTGTATTITGYGPKYYAVKTIILGYCGPCHLNGGTTGGVNWDTDASIVAKWDRIKARAVDNIPSAMPQGGVLTMVDKQKITDWVNAGHTINN